VNIVISLRSGREIDNQVRNPNEPCRYPHKFFQNSSSSSFPPSPETSSSSKSEDATDGVLNDSSTPPSLESPSKKDESKEKASSYSIEPPKDSSTEKVQIPYLLFPIGLRRKTKLMLRRCERPSLKSRITFPCSMIFSRCLHMLDF